VYPEAILIIGILMDRLSKDETRTRKMKNLAGESPSAADGTRNAGDRKPNGMPLRVCKSKVFY
jgi:hypothetical protein